MKGSSQADLILLPQGTYDTKWLPLSSDTKTCSESASFFWRTTVKTLVMLRELQAGSLQMTLTHGHIAYGALNLSPTPPRPYVLQVPQYILEQATEMASCCRVVCTQPRRISAISVAERVAGERGERLGQVVGYQIRLESRWVRPVSGQALLTSAGKSQTCGKLEIWAVFVISWYVHHMLS